MEKLLQEPLFYIYFVYGVSFLLMFAMIMKGAVKSASVPLIHSFYMLAFFGLTHGITEMVDWVRFIQKSIWSAESPFLIYASQTFLVISFVLLLQFGINLLIEQKKNAAKAIPAVLLALFIVLIIGAGITDICNIGLLGRYGFGFTGSVLTAAAFFKLAHTMKPLQNPKLLKGLNFSAIAFTCYAVFGGLIVKPIAGVPVQLFRSACAVTAAFSTFSVLEIYKYIKNKSEA